MREIKTKVHHSINKNAWDIVGTEIGEPYLIASVPYGCVVGDGYDEINESFKKEAFHTAMFLSNAINEYKEV